MDYGEDKMNYKKAKVATSLLHLSVMGLLMVFGLFSAVSATDVSKNDKCATCHVKQAQDYEQSVHYINRSGVQAGCANCHAGKKHKDENSTDTNVKTPRIDMAVSEWKRLAENSSKECKTCHTPMAMDYRKQEPRSVARHEEGFEDNDSCVRCHKGISHHLPNGWKEAAKKAGLKK